MPREGVTGMATGSSGDRLQAWLTSWPAGLTTRDLARYRAFFASFLLLFRLPRWDWATDLPASWFVPPPGLVAPLTAPPPAWLLDAGTLAVGLLLGALLVGYRTRLVSWLLPVVWILGNGVAYSWGKIDHDILLLVLPLFLGPAGWGDELSVDARRGRVGPARRWPITLLAVAVALAMFSAAVPKALTGWLSPSTQAVRGHLYQNLLVHGRDGFLAEWVASLDVNALWYAADLSAVALEAGLVLLLVRRSWFRLGLLALAAFHVVVLVTMSIGFIANLMVYAAFFVWPPRRGVVRRRVPTGVLVGVGVGVGVGALGSLVRLAGTGPPGWVAAERLGVSGPVVTLILVVGLTVMLFAFDARERFGSSSNGDVGSEDAGKSDQELDERSLRH
jgi:hypothetical protein